MGDQKQQMRAEESGPKITTTGTGAGTGTGTGTGTGPGTGGAAAGGDEVLQFTASSLGPLLLLLAAVVAVVALAASPALRGSPRISVMAKAAAVGSR